MRIVFAAVTMQLLNVVGLMLVGGLLLLWVCWKMFQDLNVNKDTDKNTILEGDKTSEKRQSHAHKTVGAAVFQVAVADISMSLDNVLAVAGAANNHMSALVIGLSLSVVLMGVGATLIAKLLQKHRWIGYLGLVLILYVAFAMMWRGGVELTDYFLLAP